ncbi:hypothetical protein SeLEV6574_g05191, partial [Synchytrium endobioticum]
MVKFIYLFAYVAAFFFFAPVTPQVHPNDQCIQGMISAIMDPTSEIDPLSSIRDRIKHIISSAVKITSCTTEEIFKDPSQIRKKNIPFIRALHHIIFDDLNSLFRVLSDCINDKQRSRVRKALQKAQALVCSHINIHFYLEGVYRGRIAILGNTAKPTLPPYEWKNVEWYGNEEAYLELVRRSAVSETRYVNDVAPGTSNTAGGGPAPVLSPFSETQGALPAPSPLYAEPPPVTIRVNQEERQIQDMLFSPTNLASLLPHIRNRIEEVFTNYLPGTSCTRKDVFKKPKKIPNNLISSVRSFHHIAFVEMKKLYEILTRRMNIHRYHPDINVLHEARALVCFHLKRHYDLEQAYRKYTPKQNVPDAMLELPKYENWESVGRYKDENEFLEPVGESAVSETRYVNDFVPGTSNTAGGRPAPVETPGALPTPSSSSFEQLRTLDDAPGSGYGAIDAPTYVGEPQGALPAQSSWPSHSDTWYDPHNFEYALHHDSAPIFDSTEQSDLDIHLGRCQGTTPVLSSFSETPGALPAQSSSPLAWPSHSDT